MRRRKFPPMEEKPRRRSLCNLVLPLRGRAPLATRLPKLTHEKKICRCCLAGRQHRERFSKFSENRAIRPGQRIHTDLMGPMQVKSLGGSRYALVFTDDFSRKSWVYFLKHKGETMTKFCQFKKRIETETGHSMQALRSDRGGEYTSTEFKDFCARNGIRQELTQALTPQQNGVVEK